MKNIILIAVLFAFTYSNAQNNKPDKTLKPVTLNKEPSKVKAIVFIDSEKSKNLNYKLNRRQKNNQTTYHPPLKALTKSQYRYKLNN